MMTIIVIILLGLSLVNNNISSIGCICTAADLILNKYTFLPIGHHVPVKLDLKEN